MYHPFTIRFPSLFIKSLFHLDLGEVTVSNIVFPWTFEQDSFYFEDVPKYLAMPHLKELEEMDGDSENILLGVRNNSLYCKRVNYSEFSDLEVAEHSLI